MVVSTYNTLLVISSFTPLPRHDRIACRYHNTYFYTVFTSPPTDLRRVANRFFFSTVSVLNRRVLDAGLPAAYIGAEKIRKEYVVYKRRQKNKTKNPIHTYINTVLTTLWGRKSLRTRPRRIVYYATATRITIIYAYNII